MARKSTKTNKQSRAEISVPGHYKRLSRFIISAKFAKWYAIAAVAVLGLSTLAWSLMGARIHSGNADQLVDPMLFGNSTTFHQATFPSTHTFLIKWPLFGLVRLLGLSGATFSIVTVGVTLLTVGVLAYIIFRIERRPLFFGTLCLALASMLMLVPAMPYAGGILPVNMAMLATRNLEYIAYIVSLVLLIRQPSLKSKQFWLGVVVLGVLVASDKLFLSLSLGGALIAMSVYALGKGWNMVSLSVNWLVGTIAAGLGAICLLALINASGLTHISGGASESPFNLVQGGHQLAQAVVFGITGIATNFGANPGFDGTIIKTIPHLATTRIFSPAGPEFIINFIILLICLWAAVRLVISSLKLRPRAQAKLGLSSKLSLVLISSFVAAIMVFVLTNHYYSADARYLTIGLFALIITLANVSRTQNWRPEKTMLAGLVILLSMLMGVFGVVSNYHAQRLALAGINQLNNSVAQALAQHPVSVLVGDYWRVMPISQDARNNIQVEPLASCSSPRQILSSEAWQPDLKTHSFAYLLSFDKGLTDYPSCSLQQILSAYGHPNSSTIIAGSPTKPQEMLLFFDHGERKSTPGTGWSIAHPTTVLPIALDQLPGTSCPTSTTLNIVAHQDDDLLFMNPDIMHDITAGNCVRTIYVTSGDAGSGQFYWIGRQQGSEAAYSYMAGLSDVWTQRTVALNSHEFVTIASPRGDSNISLLFINLPDGNLWGQGFSDNANQSLSHLADGSIKTINSVDGQSSYSSSQLLSALANLMTTYAPNQINTLADFVSHRYPDHNDHLLVNMFTKKAYAIYQDQQFGHALAPLHYYIGYPIRTMPPNVSGTDLSKKQLTFLSYTKHDPKACQTIAQCNQGSTYGGYLDRQYQNSD